MNSPPDPGPFEDVFAELFPRAYRLAYRLLGRVAAAEDVAAETLARTFLHWNRIGNLPHRDAWVLRVAANLAIDELRRPPQRPAAVASDAEDLVDLRLALAAAIRSLPRRQREAIVLRYLADLPSAEVAGILHISQGSVKLHVHRGLEALRRYLGPSLQEVLTGADS